LGNVNRATHPWRVILSRGNAKAYPSLGPVIRRAGGEYLAHLGGDEASVVERVLAEDGGLLYGCKLGAVSDYLKAEDAATRRACLEDVLKVVRLEVDLLARMGMRPRTKLANPWEAALAKYEAQGEKTANAVPAAPGDVEGQS
jgi:hypothetical protein